MSGDTPLTRILAVRSTRGRHSPLFLWMRDNHAALAAEFQANGPQWAERVRLMGEAGLLDRTGKPPTVRGAMQTWYRVCAEMERKAQGKPQRASIPTTPSAAVRATPPSHNDAEEDADDLVQPMGGPRVWKPGEEER